MIIHGGRGDGKAAGVTEDFRLMVHSIGDTLVHHDNAVHRSAYTALFAVTPAGANDCIFYLKNKDDRDLHISSTTWQVGSAERVQVKLKDTGTLVLSSGIEITPGNLNDSNNKADVDCYSNLADAAVDLTGLSGGVTLQELWLAHAFTVGFSFGHGIILPKNSIFTIYAVAGSIPIRGAVAFSFHDGD